MVTVPICFPDALSAGMNEVQLAGRNPEAVSSNDNRAETLLLAVREGSGKMAHTVFRGQAGASGIKEEYCHSHY